MQGMKGLKEYGYACIGYYVMQVVRDFLVNTRLTDDSGDDKEYISLSTVLLCLYC